MVGLNISRGRRAAAVTAAVILVAAAVQPVLAQQPATEASPAAGPDAQSPPPPKVLTGKERLGGKWTDEQRIDNCKVPIDKRGPKPRPDACSGGSDQPPG